MKIKYGVKGKIYPTKQQQQLLSQYMGNCRFVWNYFLALQKERYEKKETHLSEYATYNMLPSLKQEYDFLKQSPATTLQATLSDLSASYKRFFQKIGGYPNFKKKDIHNSICIKNNQDIRFLSKHRIRVPKLGSLKVRMSREILSFSIQRIVITKKPSGCYELSVLVACESKAPFSKTSKVVGIDLGLNHYAVLSNGTSLEMELFYRDPILDKKKLSLERKLARQRILAKERGVLLQEAKNYQKTKRQLAKLHEKIRNKRRDFLHKQSRSLVEEYDRIAVEDLNISTMLKDPHMARSISNSSWGIFLSMLEYKAGWYGKKLVKVDPTDTSQICSHCGKQSPIKLDLSVREWTCPYCGTHHDRDINASRNILHRALSV